jgi:hypothetical protein
MAKRRPDKELYDRLRNSGVRKKVAKQASRALPDKGSPSVKAAERVADDLSAAASDIRDLITRGPQKRSEAAKKAARTRKKNKAERSAAAKKAAKSRKKSKK